MKMKTETINRYKRKIIMLTVTLISLVATSSPASIIAFDEQYAVDGDKITFTVFVQNAANEVDSLGFEVGYDATVLSYSGFIPGELTAGFTNFSANNVDFGRVRIGGFDVGGHAIAPGTGGALVSLIFTRVERRNCELSFFNLIDDLKGWGAEGFVYIDESTGEDSKNQKDDAGAVKTGNENSPAPEVIQTIDQRPGVETVEETPAGAGTSTHGEPIRTVEKDMSLPAADESYPVHSSAQQTNRFVPGNRGGNDVKKVQKAIEPEIETSANADLPEASPQTRSANSPTIKRGELTLVYKTSEEQPTDGQVAKSETETGQPEVKQPDNKDDGQVVTNCSQPLNNAIMAVMIGIALIQMLILIIQVYSLKKINGLARFTK